MAELVVAFDHSSGREALALADRLPRLRWAKLGPILFVREGPALVREFTARGVRVFLDLKWHDIPNTVAGAVTAARDLGVTMASVHCLGGQEMLGAAAAAAGDLALVGVTVLTSHSAAGFEADLALEVARLARLAIAAGLRGVVASPREIGLLREVLGGDPWIVVPGIRRAGEPSADQVRVATPRDAVQAGATHLVVGRPITAAQDPPRMFQEIEEEMS